MYLLDFRVQRIEEKMGQRLPDRFYASKLSFDSLSLEASGTYTCVKHYEFDCANSLTSLCPINSDKGLFKKGRYDKGRILMRPFSSLKKIHRSPFRTWNQVSYHNHKVSA